MRLTIVFLLVALSLKTVANAREWTDNGGKSVADAEFVRAKVTLRLPNGKLKIVDMQKLSKDDQLFVVEMLQRHSTSSAPNSPDRDNEGRNLSTREAVTEYLNENYRLLSVERMSKPDSLNGAVVRFENVWFDAQGDNSFAAFDSAGDGYCDQTCEVGIRVIFKVDEGFERATVQDQVLFLTKANVVTGHLPSEFVRFKRSGIHSSDVDQQDAVDFLSGRR